MCLSKARAGGEIELDGRRESDAKSPDPPERVKTETVRNQKNERPRRGADTEVLVAEFALKVQEKPSTVKRCDP